MPKYLLMLTAMLFLLVGCGETTENVETNDSEVSAAAEENVTDKYAYLNDTLTIRDIAYKVTNIQLGQEVANYTLESGYYLAVTIEVTNNANGPIKVRNDEFIVVIGEAGYKHDTHTTMYLDGGFFFEEINPKMSKTATIVYEVPTTIVDSVAILQVMPTVYGDVSDVIVLAERP